MLAKACMLCLRMAQELQALCLLSLSLILPRLLLCGVQLVELELTSCTRDLSSAAFALQMYCERSNAAYTTEFGGLDFDSDLPRQALGSQNNAAYFCLHQSAFWFCTALAGVQRFCIVDGIWPISTICICTVTTVLTGSCCDCTGGFCGPSRVGL